MKTKLTTNELHLDEPRRLQANSDYPIICVLIGPCALGVHAWTEAAIQESRDVLQLTAIDFPLKRWLLHIEARHGLLQKILTRLATRASCDPHEFKNQWSLKTTRDRESFWGSLPSDDHDHSLARILHALEQPAGLSELAWDKSLIQAVFDILPATAAPSLLFTASTCEELLEFSKTMVGWVEAVPQLTMVIVVTPEAWQAYLDRAPASRTKAILLEGAELLPVTDSFEAAVALEQIVGVPIPLATVLTAGIDTPLFEVVQALAKATSHCPQSEEENDLARSQAERTLFEFLERWPETAGRFAQNAQLDFQFGPRAAEIDLFCRDARIAVEIDGYFHFQSDGAYRRDRAKDWELQRRGYLVLRFLANDILPRLDEIRDRIFAALAPASRSMPR